ncbi:coagulation factor XI-like [Hippoglossus stenolepis]|uniref:coagulation factor XI-like n=1 Tax=Hippoglossus stenolepis TaxID=195615 RepID=UPI001FAF76C6|nr:coagulation factor XI-like [Hippoglossus stenolepis]
MGTRAKVGVTSGIPVHFCQMDNKCAQELIENVDFPGSDITFLYSPDARHCQQLCTEHPSCLFFTFVRHDWTRDKRNFYCYIKSTPSLKPNVQTPLQRVTSGFSLKNCTSELQQPDRSQLYQNMDFLGPNYKSLFTSSDEECQRVCTQDRHCRFFTFVNGVFTPETIRYNWPFPFLLHVHVSGYAVPIPVGAKG